MNTQNLQNQYQGKRIGENIGKGKLPAHHKMIQDYIWNHSNIESIAEVERNVEGEKYIFTQVMPPKVFTSNKIDGVGSWSYSVVSDNTFTLSREGFRYMNDIIPSGTWSWVSTSLGYQAEYYRKAAEAWMYDELYKCYDLLESVLPESTLDIADYPNLKSLVLAEVNALEKKTAIPRNYFTISFSQDALDMFTGEEIVAQNLFAGADEEGGRIVTRNPWGVRNIATLPVGGHDRSSLYTIHIQNMLKAVTFAPTVAPGFYNLAERNGSPANVRFAAEDGFTVDYMAPEAGVRMTKSAANPVLPTIRFISSTKAIEVPVGATLNLAYLKDNYGLEGIRGTFNKDRQGEDITDDIVVNIGTLDTALEGLGTISLELADPDDATVKVTDQVIVKVRNGVHTPVEQVTLRAEVESLRAEVKNLKSETKTTKTVAKKDAK